MPADTSLFTRVIQEHLELKERNARLEASMPIGRYKDDDPFHNHPLFKTEEQARLEETMDGEEAVPAEADVHLRRDDVELRVEPGPARGHLAPVRLLVDAPLAARLPLEVLDDVRDVGLPPVDPRLLERLVEDPAGRADERLPRLVLLVAGLLADEHHVRRPRALAEHCLRRVLE